jgi:hypothetical protein
LSCSGFYFMLHRYLEYKKMEREFKRKLKKILRKHGWIY